MKIKVFCDNCGSRWYVLENRYRRKCPFCEYDAVSKVDNWPPETQYATGVK